MTISCTLGALLARCVGWPSIGAASARSGAPEPRDLGALQRVAHRLDADLPVAEHNRVDPVLYILGDGLRRPLDEQHVALEDLRRHVPLRVRHVGEQLREPLSHAVLSVQRAAGRDEHRVVGVVAHDPFQVPRDQHLGVMLEDLLRRAGGGGHLHPPRRVGGDVTPTPSADCGAMYAFRLVLGAALRWLLLCRPSRSSYGRSYFLEGGHGHVYWETTALSREPA